MWISGAEKPGMPFSTRKPRISPSSVRAQTTATSAIVPFVIHILAPFRIQSEPSRRACVRIAPGSEPASGSVSPKQPIASPRCIAGSQRSFCSSEPQRQIANIASDPCTETTLRTPASPASSSMQVEPVRDRARAGEAVAVRCIPKSPSFASSWTSSRGQDPLLEPVPDLRQHVSRTNRRTVSRIARSSSSSSASSARKSSGSSVGDASVVVATCVLSRVGRADCRGASARWTAPC